MNETLGWLAGLYIFLVLQCDSRDKIGKVGEKGESA